MVLRLHQHSIGYTGEGFYRSENPTNSIKVLKEQIKKKQLTEIAVQQVCRCLKSNGEWSCHLVVDYRKNEHDMAWVHNHKASSMCTPQNVH